ncbi:SRPBCC family protein [Mycolicibacterium phocaicum]|uniref:SRPBCC family protein n=1 Tax=Mycolicibacterium phocaicum TaxID=319706 RepID=A0A7I7ZTR4_9MYCO|nr:SRPBCC family protein [Mycolicibacterium phocaicum]TLH59476.1 SRPBCC family protein [Mycolicibacterium phocaicum]UCZ60597.1 SRPBCC family protein [Mycolicibacterium phocaicum]BBZ56757.1 polyketide cyclase [Mycolicibacterium phocaicum]
MTTNPQPALEDSIDITAPPTAVWSLVSDVRRMADWSPQVESTRLRNGAVEVAQGVEFTNLNTNGTFQWMTHGTVMRFDTGREIAFRIEENWAVWSLHLEPSPDGGTRLTQRRESPDGSPEQTVQVIDSYLGGQAAFTESMRDGMRQTLQAIKVAAEK